MYYTKYRKFIFYMWKQPTWPCIRVKHITG